MSIVLLIIAAVIFAMVVRLSAQPANYEVVRRRVIKVKPEQVYPLVADLKHWASWSPWIMHEPNTTLEFGESTDAKGAWYSWQGQYVGAGKMVHKALVENESIEQDLTFYKPMKSTNEVYWRFNPVGEHTEVTWGMRGKMPFFMRWMSKLMDGFVGKDYEIGLGLLAMKAGDLSEPFEMEFLGEVETEAQDYIGSHYAGPLEGMTAVIGDEFKEVMKAAQENGMAVNGPPMTLYHEFNKKDKLVICDIAVPVVETKAVDGLVSGTLLGQKYMRTTLKGDYMHLENTWYSAFSHLRMSKAKLLMGKPMVERYMSDPADAKGLDLVTYLDLPVK